MEVLVERMAGHFGSLVGAYYYLTRKHEHVDLFGQAVEEEEEVVEMQYERLSQTAQLPKEHVYKKVQ